METSLPSAAFPIPAPLSNSRTAVVSVKGKHWRIAAGIASICILVLCAYRPILPGNFLMDDTRLVNEANPIATGELTPGNVWFQSDFPLTELVWRAESLAWGDRAAGYHVVNLILQALSALLLWRLLVELKIPGAWLAGALFAIHPVGVNSVARIAELKNTLSLPFFLLSFLAYVRYDRLELSGAAPAARRRALWLALSLMAFVLALFAKTSVVMLPVTLLACAGWQRGRLARRDFVHTAPWFGLSAAFGLMSLWFQRYQAMAGDLVPAVAATDRLAGAGRAFWFYLEKGLWPVHLNVFYPHWRNDYSLFSGAVPLLLLAAVVALGWRSRRTWGKHVLFGIGAFGILLFPVLGFFDGQCFAKFQVSDHLEYLPLVALVSLTAAAIAFVLTRKAFRWASVVLLLGLAFLTHHRAQAFADPERLMRDTLAGNPAAWPAENDLGVLLAKKNDLAGAMAHFNASLRLHPDNPEAHANLGQAFAIQGRFDEALAHFRAALQAQPQNVAAHEHVALALEALGRNREALVQLSVALRLSPKVETRLGVASLNYRTGNFPAAVVEYRRALALKPDLLEALNNLAWMQATCPEDAVRNGAEAVQHAERACRLTEFKKSHVVSTLAAAYAEAGRFEEAISTAETARRLQIAAGETRSAALNQRLIAGYRAGQPWRERTVATRN